MNRLQIEEVKYTKFLGVYIGDDLSWKHHINQYSTKISQTTGIIGTTRHYLSLKV